MSPFYQRENSQMESFMFKEMSSNLNFPRHIHSSFEFIDVLDGELTIIMRESDCEYVIDKNKAVLIPPYQVHSYRTEDYSKYIIIIFSTDYVNMFYKMIKDKVPASPLFEFTDSKLSLNLLQTDDNIMESSYLYAICAEFYRQQTFTEKPRLNVNLIEKIIEYVDENFTENITLKFIADKYNYSYHYLSNFFNENVGINFKRFINEYRINNACNLLRETDLSVTEIAQQSGYDNLRSFNREFLSIMGYTPSDYKRRYNKRKNE